MGSAASRFDEALRGLQREADARWFQRNPEHSPDAEPEEQDEEWTVIPLAQAYRADETGAGPRPAENDRAEFWTENHQCTQCGPQVRTVHGDGASVCHGCGGAA